MLSISMSNDGNVNNIEIVKLKQEGLKQNEGIFKDCGLRYGVELTKSLCKERIKYRTLVTE